MNLSKVPTVKDLFKANKVVWQKYKEDLILGVVITLGLWILEGLFDLKIFRLIPIFGGLPPHYLPEWYTMFYLGCFAAEIKKTLIPMKFTMLATYLFSVFGVLFILGFSMFSLLFSLLFMSPFLFGYFVERMRNWRKTRKE